MEDKNEEKEEIKMEEQEQQQEKEEKDFQCPYCNELFTQPITLNCKHSYCLKCAETIYGISILQSFEICTSKISIPKSLSSGKEIVESPSHYTLTSLACQICHKVTEIDPENGINIFPINKELETDVENFRKLKSKQICGWCNKNEAKEECYKCEVFYCNECKISTHLQRAAFSSHKFYEIGILSQLRQKTCKEHKGKTKDVFCKDCNNSYCYYCTNLEPNHKNHKIITVSEANREISFRIDQLFIRCETALNELNSYQALIISSLHSLQKENDVIIDQIKDKFNSLHTIIATRESQLVNFVQAKTKADVLLGEKLINSINHARDMVNKIINKYPRESQDPLTLVQFEKHLSSITEAVEDVEMESSLCPLKFDFRSELFESVLISAGSILEQLEMNEIKSSLADEESTKVLKSWLSKYIQGKKQCNLVYKASHPTYGWSDKNFQVKSSLLRESAVVIIIKTESGHVAGGFRNLPWNSSFVNINSNQFEYFSFDGNQSFVFSLSDGKNRSPICCETISFSFADRSNSGLSSSRDRSSISLDTAKDFYFSLNSKTAYSHLGKLFAVPSQDYSPTEFLLGAYQAKMIDLEMFSIGSPQTTGPKHQEILRGYPDLKKVLTSFVGKQYHKSNLLYKASKDGWFDQVFHDKCDDKGSTLVIAKSEHGHIFGGVSIAPWSVANVVFKGFILDNDAFLFSLTDGHGRAPFKLPIKNTKMALQQNYKAGPVFGGGPDMCVLLNQQLVQCNPHSYSIPNTFRQDTFLSGASQSRLEEVEVYLIN